MKVFVSTVDSALGHNLSRLFASTIVGSRKSGDAGQGGDQEPGEDEENHLNEDGTPITPAHVKEPYQVWGTLMPQDPSIKVYDDGLVPGGGPAIPQDVGDRKRDLARREVIDKFAVPGKKPKWVSEIIKRDDDSKDALKQALLESDIIVYDIVQSLEEATWAIDFLAEMSESFLDKPKTFIGVSSVLTWARTKVDQDDTEASIGEDEYKRRKPHPNFKSHITLEKAIIKGGKRQALKTYVIASGLVYHAGDSIFHYLFKTAWHNQDLVCFGDGGNTIPTIHMDDLTQIIVETAETTPETRYLLAVDESKSTLWDITKAISESLGTSNVIKMSKESALTSRTVTQIDYDMLLTNVRLDPGHVKEMSFEWKYEGGIVENLPQLIQEFKDARGLSPIRIVMHGPPAVGKTYLSRIVAAHYEIHILEVDAVVSEAIARLERRAAGNLLPDESEDDIDADKDLLEEIREYVKSNNGKYPEEHVMAFLREKLKSVKVRNQGYVLDGFPTNTIEATQLFKSTEDDASGLDEVTGPDFVFSFESTDDFIKERIMSLPESSISNTKNTEEALTKRLEEFRALNTEENTVLNFFDEAEVHPITITIDARNSNALLEQIIKHVGKPHNYGPTPEQIAERRRIIEETKTREAAIAEDERQKREKEETERHTKAVAEWNAKMEEIKRQEQEVLEAQGVPLRNYLMKYVMPVLTSGLIDVCKVRPEDPVDYLAEYLFKHNIAPSE